MNCKTITIANKLRIYEGNILLIPGCEPISTVTNIGNYMINPAVTSLMNNFDTICKCSYISVYQALELIPGSYIINNTDPANRWFVLPEGPPPPNICPCGRGEIDDWYAILRENADCQGTESENNDPCGNCW